MTQSGVVPAYFNLEPFNFTQMLFMKSSYFLYFCFLLFLLGAVACQSGGNNQNEPTSDNSNTANFDTVSLPRNGKKNPGIAEDYTNTNRVIWQKPDLIIDLLGDLSGKTVADIGAGTGFFALRLAPQAKKVIAIDIDQRFIRYLDSVKVLELPEKFQSRLEVRLAEPDDPRLQPSEADVVMIVNTFMYIEDKAGYLKILQKGMSKGGRLVIVDFKKKRTPIGPPADIRTPIHVVEEALYATGYRNIVANDTALDYQYIVTAEK